VIREHVFNSQWWGERVGIVQDPDFFSLTAARQQELLRSYAWVEFVAPLAGVAPAALTQAGFYQADTQIGFKVDMTRIPPLPDFTDLVVTSAADTPFTIAPDDLAAFEHERFRYLPGITMAKLSARYASWAKALITAQPEWCLMVTHGDDVQGWFFSERDAEGFHLTLATLHRKAQISGMLLYQIAINTFVRLGQRVGAARFSVTNTAVHNIYARLGARFLAPSGCWLWVREQAPTES
jgi:hypothetical protein